MFFAILSHAHLFAIACLACMGIGAAQVQRGWRSIDQVRGHLADIHREPERRLTGRYPAEIAPLAADVNRLLDQRDAMVARASLAAGDLAHGLKTPLAILTLDGARAARDGHAELAASIRAQVDRMRRQVDTHLARARIDVSRHRAVVPVPLLESIEGIVRTLERLYGERGIAFDLRVSEDIEVLAVREDLDEILGNVLENACKWARTSCRVDVRIDAGQVAVVIDDDGPGIPDGGARPRAGPRGPSRRGGTWQRPGFVDCPRPRRRVRGAHVARRFALGRPPGCDRSPGASNEDGVGSRS